MTMRNAREDFRFFQQSDPGRDPAGQGGHGKAGAANSRQGKVWLAGHELDDCTLETLLVNVDGRG
jgi:hypothetical protein